MRAHRAALVAIVTLISACSIPVDVGPIERPFQPQFPSGTNAIAGFPREKVDFGMTYGDGQVGKLVRGDTISLYLLHDDRDNIPVTQLRDTVRIVNWSVQTWRLVGGLGGSHYGEDGIASIQQRDGSGRGLLTALKPGLVYIGGGGWSYAPLYSCNRENCVNVVIVIGD